MRNQISTNSYQRLFNFFELSQRERMDGLDQSYFSEMTAEEKEMAFQYLERYFEVSEESLKGMYLCFPDRAITKFKEALKKPMHRKESKREDEALLMCRILMAGYVCNAEPTAENINVLANFDIANENEDIRAMLYKMIPSNPTSEAALETLENAILTEKDRLPASTAIIKFMASYNLLFDMNDSTYKKVYRGLMSDLHSDKVSMITTLKTNRIPNYAPKV